MNLKRGDSSRRGGGRGRGDAEDETTIPVLDYACGYGLSDAARLKQPALFIERVQLETLSRENQLKVPKARYVEIQKEDPDNVDRLCERLQREISQMHRRLARDMQLYIVKKDAQKNRTEPNVAAIKGIMEDPELVSDPELSDYSDSEIADLSAN
ncbi:unnamed protein product [Camellia sinensis]